MPHPPAQRLWQQFPVPPCPCLCCVGLLLPAASPCAQLCSLPGLTEPIPTPRPRGSSACAGTCPVPLRGQQGNPPLELVLLQARTSRRATMTGPVSAGIVRDTSRNSPALLCSQRLPVSRGCADFSPGGVSPVLPLQATFNLFLTSAACPCCLQVLPCLPYRHLLCTRRTGRALARDHRNCGMCQP